MTGSTVHTYLHACIQCKRESK